jgi:hypothetical protein
MATVRRFYKATHMYKQTMHHIHLVKEKGNRNELFLEFYLAAVVYTRTNNVLTWMTKKQRRECPPGCSILSLTDMNKKKRKDDYTSIIKSNFL